MTFLATTALETFWDRSGPILFLGAWCTLWPARERCIRPQDVVLPSVWGDRARFYEAARYADACAERLLPQLAAYLDGVHGAPRGVAYWRVIIGPWLINYVHAAYDRWVHLLAAFARAPDLHTVVLDPAAYWVPPTGSQAHAGLLVDDAYNLQIVSQLLTAMGHCFPARALGRHQRVPVRRDRWPRRVLHSVERAVATRLNGRVGMIGTSLSFGERWALAAATRGDIIPLPQIHSPVFEGQAPVYDARRRGLAALEGSDPFERAVIAALPGNFPTLYLEGHAAAQTFTLEMLARMRVGALYSETAWYWNEAVKYFAGEAAVRGTRLIAAQHGGGYGMYRFSSGELHERRLAHRYLVWGWADDCGLRNWPSLTLSRLARARIRPRLANRGILLIITTQSRYLHEFRSQPLGTQFEDYLDWQVRFLERLPGSLQHVVAVRPHVNDSDHDQVVWPRIATRFPNIARDHTRSFLRAMGKGRLLVIDHCATTMLEALVANVPTVLFWDPTRWEVRSSVEPLFDTLRRLRVLHDSPEDAACHVGQVYNDPWSWWRGAEIQANRISLVERFARHRSGGIADWARGLVEEAVGS